jgi:hypothetical protein
LLLGKYTSLATVGSFAGMTLISYPLTMHSSANPFGPVPRSPLDPSGEPLNLLQVSCRLITA